MSEGHQSSAMSGQDSQMLTAEYKDGQLQIVEVIPFDKDRIGTQILSGLNSDGSVNDQAKCMQILDTNKGLVQLDLLNFTLVRCQDGEDSYQLVANAETSDTGDLNSDTTVTCVLQSSDNEGDVDPDNQESYVVMDPENGQGPLVFLKSALDQAKTQNDSSTKEVPLPKKPPSPAELLEKAKALQKAKALISECTSRGGRGRKRKGDLPPPHELLASPNFKLYLYSCKLCNYKCNAVKEMSAHKASEHGGGRARGAGRGGGALLQCARCPFRASMHSQLMKHVQERHLQDTTSGEGGASGCTEGGGGGSEGELEADVLVCGACGYETPSKDEFRTHIVLEHGVEAC